MNRDGNFIKIYYADTSPLENEDLFRNYFEKAGNERKEKINALKRHEDRLLSLGAYSLLAAALERENIHLSDLNILKSPTGKPYAEGNGIYFNLSHSGKYVMCSVSDAETGCDTEKIRKADVRLAKKYFTDAENEMMENADEPMKNRLFTKFWTIRESCAKLTGEGIKAICGLNVNIVADSGKTCLCAVTESENANRGRIFFCKTYFLDIPENTNCFAAASEISLMPSEMTQIRF